MRWLIAFLFVGCANASPAYGPGPAHWGTVYNRNHFNVAEAVNPTNENVVVDCDDMRLKIPPHTKSTILIPYGGNCDLQNEDTYPTGE